MIKPVLNLNIPSKYGSVSFGNMRITQEMLEYYINRGIPHNTIAKELGISLSQLARKIKYFGIVTTNKIAKEVKDEYFMQLYKEKLPISTIKNRMKYKGKAVYNKLEKDSLPQDVKSRYIADINDSLLRRIAMKLRTPEDTIKNLLK